MESHVNGSRGGSLANSSSAPKLGGALETLMAQARAGSTEALGQLLLRCQRYLLLVANASLDSDLRPKAGASDLVQDTFLEASRDFSHFYGKTEQELLAWLTKILSNRLSNHIRGFRHTLKREVHRELSLEAGCDLGNWSASQGVVTPHQAITAEDEAARLRVAVERLPEDMRQVLRLRTWERQSFAEIASQLGSTPEAARKLWSRAVRQLQSALQEDQ
jgi:RNA polymerase sigma-70 factor (ECF subfamily)